MNKLRLWSYVFIGVALVACVPLTIEIYGDMNTAVLIPSGCVFGGALAVSLALSYIKVALEYKAKRKNRDKSDA